MGSGSKISVGLGHTISDFVFLGKGVARQGRDNSYVGWRALLWRAGLVAVFLVLAAGVFRAMIFQGAYFRALSDGNRVRKIPIHAQRGIIYDQNGIALVANLPSYRLRTCPSAGGCETSLISKTQAIELQANGLSASQSLELDSTRNYVYGPVTSHLVGYVSQITTEELSLKPNYLPGDLIGRGGLEQEYESWLRGVDGQEVVEVDALGNRLKTLAKVLPVSGKDLFTSIDINVQKVAFEQIKSAAGAVVVTNPDTGEVMALLSTPSFDPNIFTDFSTDSSWRQLKVNEVLTDRSRLLFDRAISGTYPSGSTFKIVTATAGLETGKITENFEVTDPGILIIGPYKFPNWLYLRNGGTQGTLNVVSAIQKSNDIFFYEVGGLVGVDGLSDWALKFGLNGKLGIDLPSEAGGSFPTPLWRSENKPEWYLGDTYHLAIGQGDLLVTPLQVNRWTSVVANGGKVCVPQIGKQESRKVVSSQCREIGISARTIDLIRQGMVAACSPGGTAWPLFEFRVKSSGLGDKNNSTPNSESQTTNRAVQIACKTGTAEFGDPKNRTHAWLTAFVDVDEAKRFGKEPVAVTVLVEGGGEGSDVAAPIVKKVLETYFSE